MRESHSPSAPGVRSARLASTCKPETDPGAVRHRGITPRRIESRLPIVYGRPKAPT